jgi:hypothetical protein
VAAQLAAYCGGEHCYLHVRLSMQDGDRVFQKGEFALDLSRQLFCRPIADFIVMHTFCYIFTTLT